jgi:pyruvate,orthophosphate dikinase
MHPDALLVMLSIKGIVKAEALAAVFAVDTETIERELERLQNAGFASPATVAGVRLTADGRTRAAEVVAHERSIAGAAEMDHAYEAFVALNDRFKRSMMAWQLRDHNGASVPNDHTDADYDAEVIGGIGAIDRDLAAYLAPLVERVPRLARYAARFADALARARGGERRFVAAPMIDSYHTVWFELHEDLIRLSGRTRAAEAAAGRGA